VYIVHADFTLLDPIIGQGQGEAAITISPLPGPLLKIKDSCFSKMH